MTSSVNGQDRLREIWAAWSLPLDETMSKAQLGALEAVSKWLEAGQTDPEVMIRVVQVLLADPELTDIRQHASWTTVCKVLAQQWVSAGTVKEHVSFGQAILLAAWPSVEQEWFARARLFDGVWVVRKGHEPKEFVQWRRRPVGRSATNAVRLAATDPRSANANERDAVLLFGGIELNSQSDRDKILLNNSHHDDYFKVGAEIARVLKTHEEAISRVSEVVVGLAEVCARLEDSVGPTLTILNTHLNSFETAFRTEISQIIESNQSKLDLLWWGQSRYCRALQKPYLRMKSDSAALLWWSAREAAELATSVEVEPAAAYLVETLHNLDQNIDEQKPVLDWMEELYTMLNAARNNVPRLSKRLDDIAKLDALGLPVTWVRRRVMDKEPFDRDAAKNDVALHLEEKIDRGDWASWVFRETLLDLHLAEKQ